MNKKLYKYRQWILLLIAIGIAVSVVRHWGDWRIFFSVVIGQIWFGRGIYYFASGKDIIYWGGGFVGTNSPVSLRVIMAAVGLAVYVALFFY